MLSAGVPTTLRERSSSSSSARGYGALGLMHSQVQGPEALRRNVCGTAVNAALTARGRLETGFPVFAMVLGTAAGMELLPASRFEAPEVGPRWGGVVNGL
jgi:hypothetical protein